MNPTEIVYRQKRNDLNARARKAAKKRGLPITEIGRLTDADLYAVYEYCGKRCQWEGCENTDVTFDHVKPLEKGGKNVRRNLGLLCESHNKAKADRITPDYRNGRICPDDYVAQILPANTQKTDQRGGLRSTSWKPGQSGNPNGAPKKGMSWGELIKAEGDKWHEELGITRKEYLVMCAFDHAENGNAAILKELFQRSEPQADELNLNIDDKRPATPEERRARLSELLERARRDRPDLVA